MFAHKFKAPVVTISTYGTSDFFDWRMGLATPWAHVPHSMIDFSDDMTFSERLYNVALSMFDSVLIRQFLHLPHQREVAEKYFGNLAPLPSLESLSRKIALTLVYTHRSISYPRPSMPGLINIGGAHIKDIKPLPTDIQQFIDEASHGVIFFSLGTFLKSSRMPKDHLTAFLNCFKQLKQRVIWKFDKKSVAGLPSNVLIRNWLPQNDILAHPNVVLFISHGGMFGTVESLWHGVPLLMTALFGDQHRYSMRAARAGYGRFLPFSDITNETLMSSVEELLTNKSYSEKAQEVSSIFKANLVPPMEKAMFWIEYVCQFDGANHLKSHAINITTVLQTKTV